MSRKSREEHKILDALGVEREDKGARLTLSQRRARSLMHHAAEQGARRMLSRALHRELDRRGAPLGWIHLDDDGAPARVRYLDAFARSALERTQPAPQTISVNPQDIG